MEDDAISDLRFQAAVIAATSKFTNSTERLLGTACQKKSSVGKASTSPADGVKSNIVTATRALHSRNQRVRQLLSASGEVATVSSESRNKRRKAAKSQLSQPHEKDDDDLGFSEDVIGDRMPGFEQAVEAGSSPADLCEQVEDEEVLPMSTALLRTLCRSYTKQLLKSISHASKQGEVTSSSGRKVTFTRRQFSRRLCLQCGCWLTSACVRFSSRGRTERHCRSCDVVRGRLLQRPAVPAPVDRVVKQSIIRPPTVGDESTGERPAKKARLEPAATAVSIRSSRRPSTGAVGASTTASSPCSRLSQKKPPTLPTSAKKGGRPSASMDAMKQLGIF